MLLTLWIWTVKSVEKILQEKQKTVEPIEVNENTFDDIDFIEYHVDAITGGTDALIDVIIKLQKGDKIISARGTEPDIINASVKAYISGVNRLLSN